MRLLVPGINVTAPVQTTMDQYVKQVQNIAIFKLWGVTYFYRPQRNCDKVMFLHVFVILSQHPQQVALPGRGSLSGGHLCPGGSLSGEGGSVQGVSVQGSLSGGICQGASVWGTPRIRKADGTHPTGMHSCSE